MIVFIIEHRESPVKKKPVFIISAGITQPERRSGTKGGRLGKIYKGIENFANPRVLQQIRHITYNLQREEQGTFVKLHKKYKTENFLLFFGGISFCRDGSNL